MFISNAGFMPSPIDRLRLPGRYASGLTSGRMVQLFDMADNGQLGPINELCGELWGKDPLIGGPGNDRLTAVSAVSIEIEANPTDRDQYRAIEAAAYAEEIIPSLRLFGFEGTEQKRYLVEKGSGDIGDVLEALSIPWYYGLGLYWPIYEAVRGYPKPRPIGLEFIDPRRYRLGPDESLLLEDSGHPYGLPLREVDWFRWFSVDASRAGSRIALSGVGRALIFWWWLRISGCFDFSRYLEKFGVPNVIGSQALNENLGAWDDDQRADFELFLQSYQSDVGALLPPNFKADIMAVPAGGHAVFEAINALAKSAILYGILGNEVTTTAQGSGAGAGVAGGAGSVGERIQYDLILGDRRRAAGGLRQLLRRANYLEFNQVFPAPLVKLVAAGATAPAPSSGANPNAAASTAAPTAPTQQRRAA